jgi:mannose-6-phosphate isomerase-like protein (cupin superfamily)
VNDTARLVRSGDGRYFQVLADRYKVLLGGEQTAGKYALFEIEVTPGGGPPPHVRSREDEIFEVLEGKLEFLAGDATVSAHAGDVVYVPRGVPQTFKNAGTEPARLRVTMAPAGGERLFAELDALGSTPDMGEFVRILQAYGLTLLG